MKNVTISMDDELYRTTRIAAAHAGKSMSRYLADAAREKAENDNQAGRNRQAEAVKAFLAGPQWEVATDGRMPTADDRNAR